MARRNTARRPRVVHPDKGVKGSPQPRTWQPFLQASMPANFFVHTVLERTLAPNENRSVRLSNSFARTCSRDMYATEPLAVPGLVTCSSTPTGLYQLG